MTNANIRIWSNDKKNIYNHTLDNLNRESPVGSYLHVEIIIHWVGIRTATIKH